ncbi:D-alanyl-D-alanine carboxypeptidase DacA [Zhongshania aliphaticivorans]|uniref:serine-type D-Ala-D-Ala carboxypeptidase n=1 Tax=Zhongshania aliphaticivorans TaxID=1470434 RepID=A0A5S9NV00_9GAMM|nr:D-alanyl-D-alanine carboxypeptidase family protein [Zhongshania aliphaticivorans]CAA0094564.1 D-alanyl-D-alanine carboxypeptidase DacA [Zhongshania aliphaticivorans]CAA0112567.1 D-alanyl-D-alanine carboxypeptidase DacA [Zhongshania aliphaticivorans]
MFKRVFAAFVATIVVSSSSLAQLNLVPAAPSVAASAYFLMDANSGEVLIEHNADERLPPASLTKLMTSYVLSYELERGQVSNDDLVTISKNAWAQNPIFNGSSLMWIEVGKQVTLGELHKGVVISSGNDASVAVAEHIAGSEDAFAGMMNQHAAMLGMNNSHFVNSHGLPDPEHYTSPRDLAILARAIIAYKNEYALYSEHDFVFNNIRQSNRNGLLWSDPSVDGLKTGHTTAAGYCLVTSAKRDGMRLISVVMGTSSTQARERETQKLLSYGFRYFETHQLYAGGAELTRSKVWKGEGEEVSLGVKKDVFITIPRGKSDALEAQLNVDEVLIAPIVADQVHGELVVNLDGEERLRTPLVSLQAVEEGGILKRLWDSIILFFLNLIS